MTEPCPRSALILVDLQKDFLPGGALAVPSGDAVLPPLNCLGAAFAAEGCHVYATRDWHPPDHCSFQLQGGPWPPHCVADSPGAAFADDLALPSSAEIISKGTAVSPDAYSAFERTELHAKLQQAGVRQLYVGGLATDYCVLNTVRDALKLGYKVTVVQDGIQAITPETGQAAMAEMQADGALLEQSSAVLNALK